MKKSILIHNPRCSKSRGAKEILLSRGVEFSEFLYLTEEITPAFLLDLKSKLGLDFIDIIRKKEQFFLDLKNPEALSSKEWMEVIIKHPEMLERPIFLHNNKAIIARPSELVLEIL